MKRSAADAAKTRLSLLKAALLSFADNGWRGATFEHVAERAGVTRGALHHHFRDKATLLSEALAWGWSEYGNQLFGRDDATSGDEEWLHALLREYVTLLRDDELFRALAHAAVLVAPQALDDSSNKHEAMDEWRNRIAAQYREHAESPVMADVTAGLVLVLLQGFTVSAVTRPHDLPQPEYLDAAIAALVRGLLT